MPSGLLFVVLFLVAIYVLTFGFRVLRQWFQGPGRSDDHRDQK